MKTFLLLLLLTADFLTSGCATRAVSDQEITELSLHDRRTRDAIVNDIDIEADIHSDLNDMQEMLQQSRINIVVYNGRVLITGEVSDEQTQTELINTIRVVKNVKQVHNNLVIGYPNDFASSSHDTEIKNRLIAALGQIRTIEGFDSSVVKVIVENGTVYLMGLLHRNEGAVVINVIRHQPDVKQIITIFEYLD